MKLKKFVILQFNGMKMTIQCSRRLNRSSDDVHQLHAINYINICQLLSVLEYVKQCTIAIHKFHE